MCYTPFGRWGALAEELQVLAVVEDVEAGLVLARPGEGGTQAGSAAHHLPELRLRAHLLEEHQVDDLGYIDAGVEHVDGDGDVGWLRRVRKVVDQALGVGYVVIDATRKRAFEVWIVSVETLDDELGVGLVL